MARLLLAPNNPANALSAHESKSPPTLPGSWAPVLKAALE
jgi:hypothetical protein